jgi:16S rRNA processing protein RimM
MFLIGKVLKPRGVRGEVKVEVITSFPEHFTALKELYLKKGKSWKVEKIEKAQIYSRFVYLKFRNFNSIEEAEPLRNCELYIPEEELTSLKEGEYYVHDLIGIGVFSEAGEWLGTVKNVETYAANDVYTVESENGGEFMIPAVSEFVIRIDIAEKKMVVREVEGLLN